MNSDIVACPEGVDMGFRVASKLRVLATQVVMRKLMYWDC